MCEAGILIFKCRLKKIIYMKNIYNFEMYKYLIFNSDQIYEIIVKKKTFPSQKVIIRQMF